ncbi:MAG TPA: PEP/pyruvate-binding domain-containing protein, partial [Anaerolineales bacterium]|nr:PEP/pyruvate-binding domain-containing protein [Anaerolineales bacterium]
VLFTANPLTGHRAETAIDATLGLGEALVSGMVEPDHYLVANDGRILNKTLGAKATVITGRAGGGTGTEQRPAADIQAIPDEAILALAQLGQRVAAEYDFPQDIEWAWVDSKLYLLQSRPITSLYPIPERSFDPLIVWFSFAAVQGTMEPITPLGQDAIQHVIGGAGKMFGLTLQPEEIHIFEVAGERIWVKISDVMRNPIGSRIFHGFLGFIEPSAGQIIRSLEDDPHLGVGKGRLKFSTLLRLARFTLPILARLVRNMLRPENGRARFDKDIEAYLTTAHIPPATDRFERLAGIVAFIRDRIANAFPFLLPRFIPLFGPSMAGLNMLTHLSGNPSLALEVTRGLPRNVTTEMDLALWDTAKTIQADAAVRDFFHETSASELARQYLSGTLPETAQTAITHFLERYGMRGVGEIDFGQPRWRENPTPVMHTLQSYLQIAPDSAPDVLFARGEKAAQAAVEKIAAQMRQQPGGWLKEKMVRAFARRIRVLMGARESPKFFAIRTMGIARKALLEVGRAFADAGTIGQADDLVFLHLDELEVLAKSGQRYTENIEGTDATEKDIKKSVSSVPSVYHNDWKALIAERRAVYEREQRRKQIPRILVSDGRAFYEGVGAQTDSGDVITGSPVSPGVVEGIVHVVFDPRTTQIAPGEILVCPGTDPAWTPLFLSAGGLVMEVGGMMTHGSVVAREYGIPAVVGVHEATSRLQTGQRIRVDGSTGQIMVLSD